MTNDQPDLDADSLSNKNRPFVPDRRRFLSALGAGSAVAAAGCLGSLESDDGESGDENGDESDPTIDRRFGLTVPSDDDSTSVEADHTISLLIEPRENVPIPEFYFEPTGLFVEPGDTVAFDISTPHHNVNAYHPAFGYAQRVPDETPPFSSPILTGGDAWYYTFEQEGVHDVVCAPHEIYGMAGRIVVGEASGPGANPVGEAPGPEEARPPEMTAGLVLDDPALEAEAIVDAGSVSWDELAPESKQLLIELPEE